jgi:hypothetical protein
MGDVAFLAFLALQSPDAGHSCSVVLESVELVYANPDIVQLDCPIFTSTKKTVIAKGLETSNFSLFRLNL